MKIIIIIVIINNLISIIVTVAVKHNRYKCCTKNRLLKIFTYLFYL